MQLVTVFHRDRDQQLTKVAEIEVNAPADPADVEACLEGAWRLTQNIDGSWSRGPTLKGGGRNPDYSAAITVTAKLPVYKGETYGLRSSMVGDVFEIEGKRYQVDGCGFKELAAAG